MGKRSVLQALKTNKFFGRVYGLLLLGLMAAFVFFAFKLITPSNFGSFENVLFYLQSSIIYSVGACGLYFIVVMGMFDFSIGANVVLSAIVGVVLSKQFGYIGLVIGCLLCGTLIGMLNGLMYIKLKIPSMIVTVGLLLIFESLAYYVAGGTKQILDPALQAFGRAPGNIILSFAAFFFTYFLLKHTRVGTYCYAIGSNEYIAKNMGINVNKSKWLAFVICHFLVGVMAILSVSYGTSMTATTGMGSMSRNFTPLMGTFFGVSFRKYGTPVLAIIIGEFIIAIIFNGFVALGAPTTVQNIVTGAALLAIVTLTARPKKGAIAK